MVLSVALLPSATFAKSYAPMPSYAATYHAPFAPARGDTYHAPAAPAAKPAVTAHANAGFFAGIASWFNRDNNNGTTTGDNDNDRDDGNGIFHGPNNGSTTPPAVNLPPSISGISAPTVLDAGATGTWSVSASDPENGTLSYSVDWGDQGFLHPLLAAMTQAFTQTSTFTHSYANPGTYTVKFTVKDDGGRTASSSTTVHVVKAAPTIAISNVNTTAIGQTTAAVTWTTNLRSDATVFYGTSTPVDTSTALSATAGNDRPFNHRVNLTGLTASTTYYFVAQSKDSSGNVATSTEGSFTTLAAPSTAPTISSFTGPETLAANTEGTWTVNASDPANGTLSYAITWGDESLFGRMMALVAPQPVFTQTSTFTHTYANAGTYTVTLTAKNSAGETATSSATVTVTAATTGGGGTSTTTPTISGITALVGDNGITFNWNTDESADSEVYYATSSPVTIGAAGTASTTDANLVTSHSANVTGLTAGTPYYFLIQSVDANGGTTVTHEFSLTTMGL
jgi:hypothetical protein